MIAREDVERWADILEACGRDAQRMATAYLTRAELRELYANGAGWIQAAAMLRALLGTTRAEAKRR